MSPRPYQLGKRRDQIDESRHRVIDAAAGLLASATTYTDFTIDAVAKRADVARATVYYQFGSKTGLLEALCDALAEAGQLSRLPEVFADPDPWAALRGFVAGFGRFWAADRVVMRRLRALAALDPDVDAVITARDARRREGLQVLVARLVDDAVDRDAAVRILHVITSFETFDALAGPDRDLTDVVPLVIDLARAALRPPPAASRRPRRPK
jgi:AcrR family transcriptional regulator